MNKTIFLSMMSIFVLLMAVSAHGQPGFEQGYTKSQYANAPYLSEDQYYLDGRLDQYSQSDGFDLARRGSSIKESPIYQTDAPFGAPAPTAPSSPYSLGLDIPPESSIADYKEAPRSGRAEDSLSSVTDLSFDQQKRAMSGVEYSYPSSSKAAEPGVLRAKNRLYASDVPQVTGACRLFGWQPMWLQTSSSGPVWFYEWYPSGELRVKYLGYSSAGWNKKWFNGDVPGWHILQYYCNGWSNYIYIYVYGQVPDAWKDQDPYVPAPASGTSSVTLRSSWLSGYDIYLDGAYVGTEGFGRDLSDGIYRFTVPGDMWHTIVITKDGKSYWETGTFLSGVAYRFTI